MPDDCVFRWLLDVGPLWPYPPDRGQRILTKQQWATTQSAKTALSLLPPDEQDKVLRYHFARDAKLCLGSCLLKRKAISEVCQVPWPEIIVGQDSNRKPCYTPEDLTDNSLEFNVSHHGSLVALVGCSGESTPLGIDIVKLDFERDYNMVMQEGFPSWIRTYEAVFSDREMNDIAQYVPFTSPEGPREAVRAKLRRFLAHWCLKEAYVKMTGEALLAPWLKELEFHNVQVPLSAKHSSHGGGDWGQTCNDAETWFRGKQLTDISLELQAYQEDYMLATAVSSPAARLCPFEELDYERDIYTQVARSK